MRSRIRKACSSAALPPPEHEQGHFNLQDLSSALTKLSVEQRETLLLVGAEGFSYEETARITGTNIGTVRVG